MSEAAATQRYTDDDLATVPDDNHRREIIGGELIVTPAPRHQDAVLLLGARFPAWTEEHGGKVSVAPLDVYFSAPHLVVEVSSPSTRRLELVRKRDLYERYGVPEYWYVDRDADRVEVSRLGEDGRYGAPRLSLRGEHLTTPVAPGLQVTVDEVLGRTVEP